MKALLMKDCFVLWKQLRIFIFVMLVISVFNGGFGNVFVVIWAAINQIFRRKDSSPSAD